MTEGTVTRWLKSVGDEVAVDEPLLEVSTDKVDTEIPSPVAGTLLEISAEEDDVVQVGGQLAVIGSGAPAAKAEPKPEPEAGAKARTEGRGTQSRAQGRGTQAEHRSPRPKPKHPRRNRAGAPRPANPAARAPRTSLPWFASSPQTTASTSRP